MVDVVGVFAKPSQVTDAVSLILRESLASRDAIQIVESDTDYATARWPLQPSRPLPLILALVLGGTITLLLSLCTLAIFGFGFALAITASAVIFLMRGNSQHISAQDQKHLDEGRTVVIVSVDDNAVDGVVSAFNEHHVMETKVPA